MKCIPIVSHLIFHWFLYLNYNLHKQVSLTTFFVNAYGDIWAYHGLSWFCETIVASLLFFGVGIISVFLIFLINVSW